jgi:cyclophilin family peptidyl-prolyl cis-trans isomerase
MRRAVLAAAVSAVLMQAQPADLEAVVDTEAGSFRMEFFPDKAPRHVAQFLKLAREGYYDGSAFHRGVARGMIQGGDPVLKNVDAPRSQWGTGGLSLLPAEFSDLKHERGIVSTVSIPGKPDSDGAQFFVCVGPQPALDGKYSAFARVNEGMDVVEKISESPLGEDGNFEKPVRILRVTLEKKKVEPWLNATVDEMRRTVAVKTTLGTIRIAMEPGWAPNHVRAFLKLVETGWYSGTAFHRIVKGFVAQGGMADTRQPSKGHPGDRWVRPLPPEFRDDVKHTRGVVSMARGDEPDSATTSFFLMLGTAPHLDGKYSAFGRVIDGAEVLDAFEKEELDGETPRRRIEILAAEIEAAMPASSGAHEPSRPTAAEKAP